MSSVLDKVKTAEDVPALAPEELPALAREVRTLIIETVSRTGGHLAANLGVVELTVALLRLFTPPRDKMIWDVGHQAYTYKILTGRKDRFGTLRQLDGLSGFLRRSESECDAFGAGHSGTALSAGLGMAVARDLHKGDEHVVVVLGDASAGNGITLEALNNVGSATPRLIVVLNDNEMSISANVGAISRYLGGLLIKPRYNRWKRSVEGVASRMHMGWLRSMYYRVEAAIKSLFLRSVIFEEFGLRYIGPVDGHNIPALLDALTIARESDKPILVHVATRKGEGYGFAEDHPEKWHGTPAFDIVSGESAKAGVTTYSSVFGSVMQRLAREDERVVAITAAMASGTGLAGFAREFPDRFFDVGISEEHAVVFAAGLAAQGLLPVFAVYSTFSQRVVDCVIHDVALQNLPVVFCLDRAGVVGDDGPTHHGVFDIPLFRPVPGLTIMQPRDETVLANMLHTAVRYVDGPVMIRYPRGGGSGAAVPEEAETVPIGRAEVLRPGRDVWCWALGDMLPLARDVAARLAEQGIEAGVVDPRSISPLDTELLTEQARGASLFVTFENGVVAGGFGSGVEEFLGTVVPGTPVLKVGWPREFVPHGGVDALMERYGITAEAVSARAVKALHAARGGDPARSGRA